MKKNINFYRTYGFIFLLLKVKIIQRIYDELFCKDAQYLS